MKAAKCLFPLKSAMFRISKNFDEQRLEQNRPFLTILPYISFLEGAKKTTPSSLLCPFEINHARTLFFKTDDV